MTAFKTNPRFLRKVSCMLWAQKTFESLEGCRKSKRFCRLRVSFDFWVKRLLEVWRYLWQQEFLFKSSWLSLASNYFLLSFVQCIAILVLSVVYLLQPLHSFGLRLRTLQTESLEDLFLSLDTDFSGAMGRWLTWKLEANVLSWTCMDYESRTEVASKIDAADELFGGSRHDFLCWVCEGSTWLHFMPAPTKPQTKRYLWYGIQGIIV